MEMSINKAHHTLAFRLLTLGLLSSIAFGAIAVPVITVETDSGAVGGIVAVDWDYTAVTADDVSGIQFEISYDPTNVVPDSLANCLANVPASHGISSCTEPNGAGNGLIRIILASISSAVLEDGDGDPIEFLPMGQIDFEILQPGTHPLDIVEGAPGSGFFDTSAAPVAGNFNDGELAGSIVGNAGYASAPAPGATVALGNGIVGTLSAGSPSNITVSETGDQTLDVTAIAIAGANAADFSSATAPFMIVDGGAAVPVDMSCTASARGARTATVELTNNSINDPNPQYSLTCGGLAPLVQIPAGPVVLSALTIGAAPSAPVTITNDNADGFSSIANNLTAVAGAGDTEITVSGGPTDLAAGDTFDFTVSCDNTAPGGSFTRDIDFTWDNPDAAGTNSGSITVNCTITNELAEYESVPADGSTLNFGAVLNGDTSAPLGVDIGNSDTDAVPNATLTITGATITGPNAAVFNLLTDPTGDTFAPGEAPDGANDAEVTCSPTDGFSTFTATLTISSNDPDGDATYPLTCDGDSDAALVSDPAPGTVSLGIIGPGGSADTTITLTNTGTTDDISLDSCNLAADPEITLVSPVAFPVAIGPGASTDIVLNCTPGSPGTFTGTLSCSASDVQGTIIPLNYDLICSGQAIEVPTLSRSGLLAMILALMAVGFIGFRLRQN